MEAENGVMLPQVKECLRPPEDERRSLLLRKVSSLEVLEGSWPIPEFRHLASGTVREHISGFLGDPAYGTLLSQPKETNIETNN